MAKTPFTISSSALRCISSRKYKRGIYSVRLASKNLFLSFWGGLIAFEKAPYSSVRNLTCTSVGKKRKNKLTALQHWH